MGLWTLKGFRGLGASLEESRRAMNNVRATFAVREVSEVRTLELEVYSVFVGSPYNSH
jgi:hypothetical protein